MNRIRSKKRCLGKQGLALFLTVALSGPGTGCKPTITVLPAAYPTQCAGEQESNGTSPTGFLDKADDPGISSGRWLDSPDLKALLPVLANEASQAGFCVDWVQPDTARDRCFLVVAPDPAAASKLNGFFYWLADHSGSAPEEPPLILCLDRLFTEPSRPFALAGGLYSEQKVVRLLEFTLQQVLADQYEPGILDFILDCYRKHFQQRLNAPDLPVWTLRKRFERIEVTYDASLFNSVCFCTWT